MAIFSNQATLTYNGNSTNSNIAYGEILDVLVATKTAVEGTYTPGTLVPGIFQTRILAWVTMPFSRGAS